MQSIQVTIALSLALVVLVSMIVYRLWKDSSVPPGERERRRRAALAAYGKVNDASLVEVQEGLLVYAYLVRGVEYTAAQDVSTLAEYVPTDLSALGPVSVKYDPRNPANSIVVSEQWSGLHTVGRVDEEEAQRRKGA
jgi:hypothetical protein